jgi:hypothetical protein
MNESNYMCRTTVDAPPANSLQSHSPNLPGLAIFPRLIASTNLSLIL